MTMITKTTRTTNSRKKLHHQNSFHSDKISTHSISKHSRSLSKHSSCLSKHSSRHSKRTEEETTSSFSQSNRSNNHLRTITRSSNHSIDTGDLASDANNSRHSLKSNCSWVELDFSKEDKEGKPVSSVKITELLVDDLESSPSQNHDGFTMDHHTHGDDPENDSVSDFGSDDDSFANEDEIHNSEKMLHNSVGSVSLVEDTNNLDDIVESPTMGSESHRDYNEPIHDLMVDFDAEFPPVETPLPVHKKPSSKKGISPKSSKTRRRKQQQHAEDGIVETPESTDSKKKRSSSKDPKKKLGLKSKNSSSSSNAAISARKRHVMNANNNGGGGREDDSPQKPQKPSVGGGGPATLPQRRRQRTRSFDGDESLHKEDEEDNKSLHREGSQRSLQKANANDTAISKPTRRSSRPRTKTKSKSKSLPLTRKAPLRTSSGKNEELTHDERVRQRELRKLARLKKKTSESTLQTTEDASQTAAAATSSPEKARKKRSKSKSKFDKTGKASDPDRKSRRKHRKADVPKEDNPISPGEGSMEFGIPASPAGDASLLSPGMSPGNRSNPNMYSFNMQSEEDEKTDEWLNYHDGSDSSLSHNSFAQFSIGGAPSHHTNNNTTSNHQTCRAMIPDLDASTQSFNSIANGSLCLDASVVYMAAKSSKQSLMDGEERPRSANSMPSPISDNSPVLAKVPEKQLRRRLKKEGGSSKNDGKTKIEISADGKKKVRRTKSGGMEGMKRNGVGRTKSFQGAANDGTSPLTGGMAALQLRSLKRTKSLTPNDGDSDSEEEETSGSLMPGVATLVVSAAKKQERKEKTRRKKDKHPVAGKTTRKAKSAHSRPISISPAGGFDKDAFAFDNDGGDSPVDAKALILESIRRASPKERKVRRTISNPGPATTLGAYDMDVTPATPTGGKSGNAFEMNSPMSFGSPSYFESPKKAHRRGSMSKQALLSADSDSDEDTEPSCSSSVNNKGPVLPSRGLDRTPSALNVVRNALKSSVSASGNLRAKMKKTFSISGRHNSTFSTYDDIGFGQTTLNGYMTRNERVRKLMESDRNKNAIKNSLYACMDDDDDSVELSSEIFGDDYGGGGEDSHSNTYHESVQPKRLSSLQEGSKKKDKHHSSNNSHASSGNNRSPVRKVKRIHSLPVGLRKATVK